MNRWPPIRAVVILSAVLQCACPDSCDRDGVTSPSAGLGEQGQSSPTVTAAGLPEWSPYLGVHPFGPQEISYPHLLPLIRSGAVRGLRMDMGPGSGGPEMARWALANGAADILGIFPNSYLRSATAWEELKSEINANPGVTYWEIGNEVDASLGMNPEEYTPIFLRLHEKAAKEFPDRIVMPQPVVGVGGGDKFLKGMLNAGLLERANHPDPDMRLKVLSVHYYGFEGPFLANAAAQIQRLPASTEIWVTEIGIQDWNRQIETVQKEYPRARSKLRATRIYWYVFAECGQFSLVRGLPGTCSGQPTFSPLYRLLAGRPR